MITTINNSHRIFLISGDQNTSYACNLEDVEKIVLSIELSQLTAFAIGARGRAYNPAVIVDTVSILLQRYSDKDLQLMVIDSHPEHCGIDEAISHILADTYSEAAMQLLDSVKELQ